MSKEVFVVGGGTGGHLFPAIALGEELIGRGYKVRLITDSRCKNYLSPDFKLPYEILSLGSVKSGFIAKIYLFTRLVFAFYQSIFLIIYHRPALVVGFGGYTTFPTLVAARILLKPIIIHEQNCFLGKVNKYFALHAKKIALHFRETKNLPTGCDDKIVVVGNPVRSSIKQLQMTKRKFDNSPFRIIVTGGSQGAKIFSDIVPAALKIIKSQMPTEAIYITQQSKKEYIPILKDFYNELGIKSELSDFFNDIESKYITAHLAICRSGASTISELVHLGQPAILIPYPHAAEDHQYYNANILEAKTGCVCYKQSTLTPEILATEIIYFMKKRNALSEISEKLSSIKVDAEIILADTVEEVITL